MKIPIKVSFFSAKKIKKICKKLLTLYSKSGILIMGENNNIKKNDLLLDHKKKWKNFKKSIDFIPFIWYNIYVR